MFRNNNISRLFSRPAENTCKCPVKTETPISFCKCYLYEEEKARGKRAAHSNLPRIPPLSVAPFAMRVDEGTIELRGNAIPSFAIWMEKSTPSPAAA